jgi:hypothetical protein
MRRANAGSNSKSRRQTSWRGPGTVSRVVNGSENVAPATREKILAIIRDLDYKPNVYAANLSRKRLNDENTRGSRDQSILFNPEECAALAEQIIRLRKDLDRLRKHTERIKTCVDMIQEACSR